MGILNIFDYIIGLALFPFQWFHPFVGLTGICAVITIIGMIIYKRVTNQEKLKYLQTEVKLSLMEMRLRQHTVGELVQLQFQALSQNFTYLKTAFIPSLIIVIPLIMMLPSIESRFEYIPARTGTIVSVEALLSSAEYGRSDNIKLYEIPGGLKLIEKDIIHGENNIISWHFRAIKNGEYNLKFNYKDISFTKNVIVSDKIPALQKEIKHSSFLNYLYSIESSYLQKEIPVESITVLYKKSISPIGIFGWHPDWLYSFLIIFLLLFFAIKPIAKIY